MKNFKFYLVLFISLVITNGKAQIVASGDAFLIGNLAEIGIDGSGGYEGANFSPAPLTAHYRSNTTNFGFVANPQMDGWANFDGDFFTPGSPENGWGIEIGSATGVTANNNCAASGSDQILGAISGYQVINDCIIVDWDGDYVGSGYNVHVHLNYKLKVNDLFYTTSVTITNNGSATIPDFYYHRNVDPDNNVSLTSYTDFSTTNNIVSQPGATCQKAHVTATSTNPWNTYLGFAGVGANFRVSWGGFNNRDASDIWNGVGGLSAAGSTYCDCAMSIAYRIQNLAPGASETFKYVVILDDAAANNAIADLFYFTYVGSLSGPAPTCSPITDTATTCSGNPVNITLNGSAISSFTWSWSPTTGLTPATGASVNAAPTATTTYTITGTPTTACFSPVTQQIVVEVIPGPLATYVDPGPQCGTFDLNTLTIDDANNVPGAMTDFYTVPPATLADVGNNLFPGSIITPADNVYLVYYDPVLGCIDAIPVVITWSAGSASPTSNTPCAGSPLNLSVTPSAGATYAWTGPGGFTSTISNPTIASPTTANSGTYNVTVTSGACSYTGSVNVTVNPLPTVTVPSTSACSGDPATLTASGASTYTWSPATGLSATTGTTVTATVASTTTYTITGTDANGCVNTTTATVTISSTLDPTITPQPAVCESNPAVTFTAVDAGGTWSATCGTCINAATGSFDPATATAGTYTITYTIPGGCGGTDTETMTVNPVPDVIATPALQTICTGTATGIALSSTTAGTTFAWTVAQTNTTGASAGSGASIAQTLTTTTPPSGTATYTVTPTALGCAGFPINVPITVESVAINSINTTPVLCNGGSTGTITINATGATQFSIDAGATFQASNTFNVAAGTYNIEVQNANGCSGTGTATVTEPTALTINSGVIQNETCAGSCDGEVAGLPAGGTTPYTVTWSNGGTGLSLVSLCSGSYTATVTDNNGCTAVSPAATINGPAAVVINSTPTTQPTCNGGNDATLTINASGGTAPLQYALNTGAFQVPNAFNGITAGTYTAIAEDANGCQATVNVTIGEPTAVTVTSTPDQTICAGQSATFSVTAAGGVGGFVYTWDHGLPGTPSQTVTPAATDVYNVSVVDANGCGPANDFIIITVNPPLNVLALSSQTVCPGSTASFSAIGSGGNGGPYTYTWTSPTGGTLTGASQTITPTGPMTWTVTISDGCTTPTDTAMLNIGLYTLPTIALDADTNAGCLPLTVNFTNLTGAASAGCLWDFGDGTFSSNCDETHVFGTPGCTDVTLTITTTDGCITSTTINNMICVYDIPVADFSFGPQPTDVLNTEIGFTNLTIGGSTYQWNFDGLGTSTTTNPSFTFPADSGGVYNVCLLATSANGCTNSICHDVTILENFLFYVPNAFTPDGDGVNDVFMPIFQGEDPDSYELFVFNRWGEVIFQSNNKTIGWDGSHKSQKAKEDVYVWKVKIKMKVNEEKKEFYGHVNLLR